MRISMENLKQVVNIAQEHAATVKTASVGVGGTGASIVLQNFNQAMAGMAAFATFVYICLQIFRWFNPVKKQE